MRPGSIISTTPAHAEQKVTNRWERHTQYFHTLSQVHTTQVSLGKCLDASVLPLFTVCYVNDMYIYIYMAIYTYMVLFTTVKKKKRIQLSNVWKTVCTHRDLYEICLWSPFSKSAMQETGWNLLVTLRWAYERSDLNQGCYSLSHFFCLTQHHFLWLKMHKNTRTAPHHAQKLPLFCFRVSPSIVSHSTETLKGFSVSAWANASSSVITDPLQSSPDGPACCCWTLVWLSLICPT